MSITKSVFGETADGRTVHLYTLTNANNMVAKITDFGGIVTHLLAPDKNGRFADVVLGFDSFEKYLEPHPYFGALIGRVCNRIAGSQFTLEGGSYKLAANDGKNHLHGGLMGFDKVLWDAAVFETSDRVSLRLSYLSKDGEEGYPGNLSVMVFYSLTDENELVIDYTASTDKPTPVNLTQHNYFNLKGEGSGDILDHVISIAANRYLISGEGLIPTGEIVKVENTPMDFTTPTAAGQRIHQVDGGYDHDFQVRGWSKRLFKLRPAAVVTEPVSGRVMEVLTTEPAIHLYTGNFLDGTITGKSGRPYEKQSGFCLETQHYPDSPNIPLFPSIILKPGQSYRHTTIHRFTVS